MPVETLRPTDGRLAGGPFTSAMPFRILNKGPEYFRRAAEPGTRKLSAVERLEADKAKYVKSQQVALNRQEPVKPPIIRKPLLSPSMIMQFRINTPPARKITRRLADSENGGPENGICRGPQLNLDILNNLINVCDGPLANSSTPSSPSPTNSSPSSGGHSVGSGQSAEPQPCNNFKAHLVSTPTSSPLNNQLSSAKSNRRPPPVPARVPRLVPQGSYGPNSVTVRRVDVRPQAEIRKPQRLPLRPKPRQPQVAQPQIAQPQAPPPPTPPAQPQPVSAKPPSPCLPPSPLLLRSGVLPPASPAFTRLSASSRGSRPGSTRKHPTLHRSKSDLSDRYSRATADMERFFNYCGLDPDEVEGMGGVERFARANSDIVSVSKLRSVSTPSSDCGDGRRGEDDDDDDEDDGPGKPNDRVPYGISVIERNARVIKWLYGLRQARDVSQNISNV